MRVFSVAAMAATALALVSSGCSTAKMPSFIPTFGKAKTKAEADTSKLTNAPAAPQVNSVAGQSPAATPAAASAMPSTWNNLPMYPGTSYPQTPHPDPSMAIAQRQTYGAPAPSYANMPAATGAYGAMPPAASTSAPVTPYTPYPTGVAQNTPAYSPPTAPAPSYAQPQAGAYSAAPTAPYAQQRAPYTPPANPYAAPSEPQNAANPYGNVTR
jgi:hypothetical protein